MRTRHKLQEDERNGTYFVWIMRGGVSRYFNFGPNMKEAERKLARVEDDIRNGRAPIVEQETTRVVKDDGSKDIHVKELAVRHLEWVRDNRAKNTFLLRQHYVSLFVHFIAKNVGACSVSALTPEAIERFYHWCRKRRPRKGHAPTKCGHAIREVRAMLHWGDTNDVCTCPVRRWPRPPSSPPPTRYFSDDELRKLLAAVPPDLADFVLFGTLTGLRPQEIRLLRRQHVTLANGRSFVRIEHHKTSESSKVPVPRTVPLPAEAAEIVRRKLAAHPKSDFVFLNDDGRPYSALGLRQRLQRWCRRAGVPVMPPYALRHVFGTRQAGNGTNQAILAQLMGHSNLQTTARYVVNCDEAHLKAMDAVARDVMESIGENGTAGGTGELPHRPASGKDGKKS